MSPEKERPESMARQGARQPPLRVGFVPIPARPIRATARVEEAMKS